MRPGDPVSMNNLLQLTPPSLEAAFWRSPAAIK
jgi:hypothetical protein